jgi:hypothetical protein
MSMRAIVTELGRGLAALAMLAFVLLLPMHQSAWLQRDLAVLGFETTVTWSVCGQSDSNGDHDETPASAFKCPAFAAGHAQAIAATPPFSPAVWPQVVEIAAIGASTVNVEPALLRPGTPTRAPPPLV